MAGVDGVPLRLWDGREMNLRDDIPRLLVVDDDEAFARLLERTLSNAGYHVLWADSGERALEVLGETAIDLVLLDICMPGIDGFETCRRITSNPATADTPVIFMTAQGRSNEMLAQAIEAGGTDYLTKPLTRVDVLTRVRNTIQQRVESLWLRQLDTDDKVTGLPGRSYFKSRLEEELAECGRFGTPISVVISELDGLGQICEQYDDSLVDVCATRFALLLRSESRRYDVVARLNEACFGLLLPRVSAAGAVAAAKRMSDIWRLTTLPTGETGLKIPAFFATEGYDGASPPPSGGDLLKRGVEAVERVKGEAAQPVWCHFQ